MRKVIAMIVVCGASAALAAPAALANDPHSETNPTGPPSQSCQELGFFTGHSPNSPGSPFNEPIEGVTEGGKGGQHYSEKAQYDVACFQRAEHVH